MAFLSEAQLEAALLEQLASLGFACASDELIGPDGKQPEREAYDEVVLKARLTAAVARLNPALPPEAQADAVRRLHECRARFLLVSFDTDWRFDTRHSKQILRVLQAAHRQVSFREISSAWGHDSFLLEIPEYHRTIHGFLHQLANGNGQQNGVIHR